MVDPDYEPPERGTPDWHDDLNRVFGRIESDLETLAERVRRLGAADPGGRSSTPGATPTSSPTPAGSIPDRDAVGPPATDVARADADVVVVPGDDLVAAVNRSAADETVWLAEGEHVASEPYATLDRGQTLAARDATVRAATDRAAPLVRAERDALVTGVTFDGAGRDANGLGVRGDGVVVRRCEFTGFVAGRYPLNDYLGDDVTYELNHFHDNATRGCAVSGAVHDRGEWATGCVVRRNRFESCNVGVKLRGTRGCEVHHNVVVAGDFGDRTGLGLQLQTTDDPVQGSRIHHNEVRVPDGVSDGYSFYGAGVVRRPGIDHDVPTRDNVFEANALAGTTYGAVVEYHPTRFVGGSIRGPNAVLARDTTVELDGVSVSGRLVEDAGGRIRVV